ncbi:carotenoid oxygenase family protein [Sorangium sp. So ce429]
MKAWHNHGRGRSGGPWRGGRAGPGRGRGGRRATRTVHRFPAGHTCGEPMFVPRPRGGTADTGDDGYLMTFAHDRGRGTSYLAILDAAKLEADAIGEVHLPVRVPAGFHGN